MGIKDAIATLVGGADTRYGSDLKSNPKIKKDRFPLTQTITPVELRNHTQKHILAGIDVAQRILESVQERLPVSQRFDPVSGTLVVFLLADSHSEQLIEFNPLLALEDRQIYDRLHKEAEALTQIAFPKNVDAAYELVLEAAREIESWADAKQGSLEEKAAEAQIAQVAGRLNSLQTSSPVSFR